MRKTPCNQCPFRKDALAGYLGDASYKPEEFLASMENHPIPCHMEVNWEKENGNDRMFTNPCNGSLRFLKNTAKMPRESKYAELRNTITDRDSEIFSTRHDFIKHHTNKKFV